MREHIHLSADYSQLQNLISWIRPHIKREIPDTQITLRLVIIAEEFFTNIAKYAYPGTKGDADVCFSADDSKVYITLCDFGIPFDPTKAPMPDITRPIDDRDLGGLGIFISKLWVDELRYERKDGKNILTIVKNKI